MGHLIARFGWTRTLIGVVIIGLVLHYLPSHPRQPTPHRPQGAHGSPGFAGKALDRGLASLRLWAKETYYDPALADYQAKHPTGRRVRRPRAFPPVTSPTLSVALAARRIRAAEGDTDVPPHPAYRGLPDFKRYHFAWGDEPPESTTVAFILELKNVAAQPLKAVMGKLVLRNAGGKALYVEAWHFPTDRPGAYLAAGIPFYESFAELRRRDNAPGFHESLFAPESDLTVEWTPTFVCYADDTMEGDVRATHYMDAEGLRMPETLNGLNWILKLQYPHGTEDMKIED